jgi:hypothetical protein
VIFEETSVAISKYNDLVAGRPTGGSAHTQHLLTRLSFVYTVPTLFGRRSPRACQPDPGDTSPRD